jgi:hypothetical protein
MRQKPLEARNFMIGAVGAFAAFIAIVGGLTVFLMMPWGGADEAVRNALPPPQGQTSQPN